VLAILFSCNLTFAQTNHLVISQVYGGGGNAGATLTHDYIELFNPSANPISLAGKSIQYAGATGTTWQVSPLTNVMLQPGQYYLVQQAMGAGGSVSLPTPDTTGTLSVSATAGKVALVNSTSALTGSCPTDGVIDFVGFGSSANCFEGSGPSPAPSNITAIFRANNGCTDTDNNATDFVVNAPAPRNSASPLSACGAPVDCVVSDWGDWGTCSADCDGGTQSRTRTIVTPAANGGAACPVLEETRACNEDPCIPSPVFEDKSGSLNMLVYPNPFQSFVYLKTVPIGSVKGKIRITDLQGREVLSGPITLSNQVIKVDLDFLPGGFYFLELSTKLGSKSIKLLKE
jgi:hypothetical protein